MRLLNTVIFVTVCIVPTMLIAQHEDCDIAQVICSDGPVVFNSEGSGNTDFLDPDNHAGCLLTGENQSSWYYFEFTPDMPPNSLIEFTIDPDGGITEDYDFAIYGPDVPCDDLDFPVRCSFANFLCDLCPLTGLGMGATDNSEGAQGEDGFVAPLEVQPGEGYYLILDNWYGSSDGFTLTWGGSAAAFLNCSANPLCNNLAVNSGVDLSVCAGDSLNLFASLTNASPDATVVWTDTTGANLFLSDSMILQPTLYPPADFSGTLTFTVTVTDGECQKTDQVTIEVDPVPAIDIIGDSLHCPNTTAALNASSTFSAYEWSDNSSLQSIEIDTAGIYWLSVIDDNGCAGADTLAIEEAIVELPVIQGMAEICEGDSTQLSLNTAYTAYLWNDGAVDSTYTAFITDDYSVEVTDNNGCISEASFSVSVPALPQPVISGINTICMGDTSTLSTTIGFETYLWSNNEQDSEILVNSGGTYSLTVTDALGCMGETTFNLMVNDIPVPIILAEPEFCPGDSTSVQVNDDYPAYLWSNGDLDNLTYALEAGNFSVTVTDDNNCEGIADIQIDQFVAPEPNILGDTVFCIGNTVNLSSGEIFNAYLWSDGSVNTTIEVDQPGSVSLTVTDQNGCEGTTFVELIMNALPVFNISGDLDYCENDSTLLNVEGVFPTYFWSDGSQDAMLYVNTPGAYGVTITDANGCQEEEIVNILENALPQPSINGSLSFCPGESTTLAVNGLFPSYIWSDGSDNATLFVDDPGAFSVTVTDNNNCEGIASEMINQFPEVNLQIEGDTAFCAGQSSLLDAGNSFETYLWSDNSMQSSLEISIPGPYSLVVTDANGCQATAALNMVESPLPIPIIQGGNGYCPGEMLALSSTQNWETYQWSNGTDDSNILVNTPGLYVLSVTDANGCIGATDQDVQAFPEPSPQIVGDLQFCPGLGTILTVNNNYVNYTWSDNSVASSLAVDSAGIYMLTVTDNNGCTASTSGAVSLFIVNPPQILEDLGFCDGQSIIVDAGGNYQSYLWTDGSSEPELEIDLASDYGVTVIDQNNCESSTEFAVEEYQLPEPTIQSVEGLCPGDSATLSSIESFETYLWTGGAAESELMINSPGTYNLLVSDINSCEGTSSVEILAYQNPEPQIEGITEICPDNSTVLSLSETYEDYQWTGGVGDPILNVSQLGMINVEVSNAEGCLGQTSVEIIGLPTPEFDISGDTTFCAGGSTILSVPTQFLNYEWTPIGDFPELEVSQAGDYSVLVTNSVGCSSSQSVSITEIALPEADAGFDQALDCNFRSVTLGGDNPLPSDRYSYIWAGPGIDGINQNMPQPAVGIEGGYELVVTDELYGCFSDEITVEILDLSYEPNVVLAPVEQLNCAVESTSIDGTASDALPAIQYHWLNSNGAISITDEALFTANEGGWYFLSLMDTLTGCQAIDSIFVEEDRDYPEVAIAVPDMLNCYQDMITLDGNNSSGGPNFSYQWASADGNIVNGSTAPSPVVDAPGWYILSIQDETNYCISLDSIQVDQDIAPPVANAGANQELDCTNREINLDGSASSSGSNYRFQWADETGSPIAGATLVNPMVEQGGTYYLTLTNLENGCTAIDEVQIDDIADYPTLTDISLEHPNCFGEESGQISIDGVVNGTPPFLFALNDQAFSTEGFFQNLPAGNYDLQVEDAAGCTTTLPLIIEEGSQLEIDLGNDRQINLGESLSLEPILTQPGIGVVRYDWATLDGDSCKNCYDWLLHPFETNDVQVFAIDELGCKTSDIITVFVSHPDEVYIPNAFSPNDDGVNDLFMVYSGEDVSRIRSILVLDRWGSNIFEVLDMMPNDYSMGWNGKTRGQLAMPSVYVYLIEVEFIDGDTKFFKGDITLIR